MTTDPTETAKQAAVLDECDAIEADYPDKADDVGVGARAAVMRIRARVAATVPAPADRAAVLREAADRFERDCPDAGGAMDLCMCHASEPLRAWADEAQQAE